MAGLIGSSNSPISGVGILAILICATAFDLIVHPAANLQPALTAFALFTTSIVFAVATIANNNLQDLKTGQLVGASPWRQQVALIVGVVAGSAVIPPVLNLLAQANGFAGMTTLTSAHAHPLPAPQANLIAALARGVIEHNLDWKMLTIGAGLGVGIVLLDEIMGALKLVRLPPLAVGIAIYLPMAATVAVIIGAVVGHFYNLYAARTKDPKRSERLGVLAASGMIVGESLFGVILAGLIVAFSTDAPLALVPETFAWTNKISIGLFIALIVILYGWMMRRARSHGT
jgi:putative OPT family oligopeptide transporter